MKRKPLLKRLLACALAAAVTVNGFVITTLAENGSSVDFTKVSNKSVSADIGRKTFGEKEQKPAYAANDVVRVSIFLKDKSTIEAGFEVKDIAKNYAAMSYRDDLQRKQDVVVAEIEKVTNKELDVVWNLTLAANLISANVEYGQIEKIENLNDVKEVVVETQYAPDVLKQPVAYDPNMATSSVQIGSNLTWAAGYTGAGSRIAVIDTGTDDDHQSFSEEGYLYSLGKLAEKENKSLDEYIAGLHLMTADEVAGVADKLNVKIDPTKTYLNAKLPFAYNYVDEDYDINHDNDTQGEHGSHVAGIATANAYIKTADGFKPALSTVLTQGVAPDAQLITMKVFGKGGGAYDSDYMVAIEDAIVLKADSINLSLGSGNPGTSRNSNAAYQTILDNLVECGVVVSISAGNAGAWADDSDPGAIYSDDVAFQTNGSPGSYNNALTVASIDNAGATGQFFTVGDNIIFYSDSSASYGANTFDSIAGERQYVYIDGFGTPEDWAALGEGALEGKIAVCSRGVTSFFEKANAAVEAGAIATIIYNNQPGTIGLNLAGYLYDAPCISILQSEGKILKDNATAVEVEAAAANAAPAADETSSEAEDEAPAADEASSEAEDETPAANEILDTEDEDTVSEETSAEADITAAEEEAPAEADDEAEAAAPEQEDTQAAEAEKVTYYLGTMTVGSEIGSAPSDDEYYTMSDFSSWGVPGSLKLKPEITAPGGNIYSVNGLIPGGTEYENMSGTSMASPQIAGMAALAAQYVREKGLAAKTGEDERTLIQSLLMSTAEPVLESEGVYYSVLNQGAGLANINNVINADSYILMGADATDSYKDGKVKAELGDDPEKNGEYSFSFSVNNLTAEEKTFDLSAKLFTQAIEDEFLSKTTVSLNSQASFSGSGVSGNTVTVGANGTADVNVTLTLSADAKSALEQYENGAYIEGYVFVKPSGSDADKRVAHSIPVLGYYGNWSDPSMFEVGSFVEYYLTGDEERDPYLGDDTVNTFFVTDADDKTKYYFGGNPYIDEEYIPERNAINGEDTVSVSYAAIRNAADSRFAVYGEDGLLSSVNNGSIDCAYYYSNGAEWRNTGATFRAGTVLGTVAENTAVELAFEAALEYYVDESGNVAWDELGEGAALTIPAVVDNTAPSVLSVEVDNENNKLIVTVQDNQYVAAIALFDRTGSELLAADGSKLDADKGGKTVYELSVDGVQGKKFLLQAYDYAMNTVTYEIKHQIGEDVPLPEMIALNYGGLFGNDYYWVGLSETTEAFDLLTPYMESDLIVYAATIADHYVFMCTSEGELYVAPEYDLTDLTKVCDLTITIDGETIPIRVQDMAYNYADGNIYAMLNGILLTIDKLTGEVEIIGQVPFYSYTLACDMEGTFYCNEIGTGAVYKFTLDSIDEEGLFDVELLCEYEDFVSNFLQAMEVNPETGMLWWTACSQESSPFIMIDPATGKLTVVNDDLIFQLNALIIPETIGVNYDFNGDGLVNEEDGQALLDYRTGVRSEIYHEENADFDGNDVIDTYDAYLFLQGLWTAPTKNITGIQIDAETTLTVGYTQELTAIIQPWTAADKSVTWTSDDTSVATVDKNGVITAVGVGECTVKAVPNGNKNISASCKVTVRGLEVTLEGLLQDEDGQPLFFNWNMAESSKWTKTGDFPVEIISATKFDRAGMIFAVDWDGNLNVFDSDTTESIAVFEGYPFYDMEMSQLDNSLMGINGGSLYFFYLFDDGSLASLDLTRLDIYNPVAVTSEGIYNINVGGTRVPGEVVAVLDGTGTIHEIALLIDGRIGTLGSYDTGINESFSGYQGLPFTSMVYGEDDCFYVATMDYSENTSKIYRAEPLADGTCSTACIGNVGDGVWPAVLLSAMANTAAQAAEPTHFFGEAPAMLTADGENGSDLKRSEIILFESQLVDLEAVDASELETLAVEAEDVNAAKEAAFDFEALNIDMYAINAVNETASDDDSVAPFGRSLRASDGTQADDVEIIDKDTESFDMQLGATNSDNEPVDSTNGLAIVTYDPEALELVSVDIEADYTSVKINAEEGFAIFGYVSPEEAIPAGTLFENLTFEVKDPEKADGTLISVGVAELGNGGTAEEPNHTNLLIEYSTPLYDSIGNADAVTEIMENVLPGKTVEVEVSSGTVDTPVYGGGGDFIDPFIQTTESTTAPVENPDTTTAPPADGTGSTGGDTTGSADTTAAPEVTGDNSGSFDNNGSDSSVSVDDGNTGNVGNDGNGANADDDKNQNTGVVFCIAPAAISAIAVLASKKRRK